MTTRLLYFLGMVLLFPVLVSAQNEPDPFDFGKMWTFENPPKEWFKEAYDFDPGDQWFDRSVSPLPVTGGYADLL